MPLWKLRMFARLHRPVGGEGSDLPGGTGAADALMDSLSAPDDGAPEESAEAEQVDAPEDQAPEPSALESLLDDLTGEPEKVEPEAVAPEAAEPEQPKTDEDAELEDALSVVKSQERRERIQRAFTERKEYAEKAASLEKDLTEFKTLVTSTGMDAQEFGQTLTYAKLAKSEDPKDLEGALKILEDQRSFLYQRLGREAPGVDLLSGHDDLRAAVEGMEISRERAVELAALRAKDAQIQQARQAQIQAQQQQAMTQQEFAQAQQQMEAYLNSRSKEVDHPARWKVVSDYFSKPGNMQTFVQANPSPAQMVNALRFMYDGVQIARAPVPRHQPISSRPAMLGKPSTANMAPEDRIMSILDNMGV